MKLFFFLIVNVLLTMHKYFIVYNIFLVTFIQGNVIPASKVSNKSDIVLTQLDHSKTTQAVSEGGSIIASIPLTLSNKTHKSVFNTENDLSVSKEKSVVARKGVDYNSTEDLVPHDKIDQSLAKNISVTLTPVIHYKNKTTGNEFNKLNSTQVSNITKSHKPLILSHEALAKMDEINNVDLDENGPNIKVHSINANSHPGMIMPIVITILVVPMFAIVGYMALKRGQEAWKNRHYKRMDFLLDGMYND